MPKSERAKQLDEMFRKIETLILIGIEPMKAADQMTRCGS